jgi:hypothetical protein
MRTLAPKRPPHRYCPSTFFKFLPCLSLAGPAVSDMLLSKVSEVLGSVSGSCNDEVDSFVATVGNTAITRETVITGHGSHAGTKNGYRTRTRITRGPKTAGLPVPVVNPINCLTDHRTWYNLQVCYIY